MKQTVNVNIASVAFTLDEDACHVLRNYFDEIKSRLPEDDTETMDDIEARVAELFAERISSPMRVVTLDVVRSTMNQIGSPAEFGEPHNVSDNSAQPSMEEQPDELPKKLYRSRNERSIAGVCGGLAEFFDTDPTMIRLLTLLMIFFGGLSIWAYIILWIVIPEAPVWKMDMNHKNQ